MSKRNNLIQITETIYQKLMQSTILDINYYTNAKCGQTVLFRERAKYAYFRLFSTINDFSC